jgi:hypothetical protein
LEEGIKFLTGLDSFAGIRRRYIVKREAGTDPKYGKHPKSRSAEELISSGVINLDKPPGPTSHEVVAWIKELLRIEKAGHGGTLEPPTGAGIPQGLRRITGSYRECY